MLYITNIDIQARTALISKSLDANTFNLVNEETYSVYMSKKQFDSLFLVNSDDSNDSNATATRSQSLPPPSTSKKHDSSIVDSDNEMVKNSVEEVWTGKRTPDAKTADNMAREILLEIVSHEDIQKKLSDKKTHKSSVWTEITLKLKERGVILSADTKVATTKVWAQYRQLEQNYKNYKDKIKQTGTGFIHRPAFFEMLDKILSDRHSIKPPHLSDSLKPPAQKKAAKAIPDKEEQDEDRPEGGLNDSLNNSSSEPLKKKRKPENVGKSMLLEIQKIGSSSQEREREREKNRERRHAENTGLFRELIDVIKSKGK